MFWIFMLITGVAYMLLKLGALKVWFVVFKIVLLVITIVAIVLGIALAWKWISSKKAS